MAVEHIPGVIKAFEPIVDKYGYFGVGFFVFIEGFGVPAPGQTALTAAAFFAGMGHLNIVLVVFVGFISAVIGDNVGFAIGEYGGHPLVERFGKYIFLTPSRIRSAEQFFNRNGGKVILVARFVDGLRQANGLIAGISEMRWPKFITFNVLGAVLWVGLWSAVGYYGGDHISTFLHYQLYLTIAVFVVLAAFIGYKVYEKRKERRIAVIKQKNS